MYFSVFIYLVFIKFIYLFIYYFYCLFVVVSSCDWLVFLLLLPYTGLGPFRALKVQSKFVLGGRGSVCFLKTVNINKYLFTL